MHRFASTSATHFAPTIRQLLSSPPPPTAKTHINGWVKSIRRQKRFTFAVITDGSSRNGLQAVFADPSLAKSLTNGASVRLSGRLTDSPGPKQANELQVDEVVVWGKCDPDLYPIQKQALTAEYLRDNCHLRTRADGPAAMLRLRDSMLRSFHHYFESKGFCYAHTPIITSNDCEGAGDAFRLAPVAPTTSPSPPTEFFSKPSYLTVSSQLHLEALANSISRVYTVSPCFRAEGSMTSRHLAEFWMVEAEWAFVESVEDVCGVVEEVLRWVWKGAVTGGDVGVLKNDGADERRKVLEGAFEDDRMWERMTYHHAIEELQTQHTVRPFEFAPEWGKTLKSEHERWLAEVLVRGPVFITDYPSAVKPFYMRRNDEGRTAACFDLLVPHVGELVGGSLREERLEVLEREMDRCVLSMEEYEWYKELRKFGGAPHAGFGIGFERLVGWMGGFDNIRECIAMPRWNGRMLL